MNLGLPKFPKIAGTIKEFRDWDLKLQHEYPIRYKIRKAIKLFFQPLRVARWRLSDAYWWVQYRVNPKHNYTTIKLKKLQPGYYDPDAIIFYAMFETFEEFMKRQLTNPQIVWEYDEGCFPEWMIEDDPDGMRKEIEERNALWKEMNDIYDWWVNVYPNRENTIPEYPPLPKEWGHMAVLNEDFDKEELMKEWRSIADIHFKADDEWLKEDIEMMVRLSKIHHHLSD